MTWRARRGAKEVARMGVGADVGEACYVCGMARVRISTTVDEHLLADARGLGAGENDAEMMDAALASLLARHRRIETDRAYAEAYAEHPVDGPDEWGDLATFRDAAASS